MKNIEKTTLQLKKMYRDLKGCKCIPVEIGCVQQFVDYCFNVHDQGVNGSAVSEDGKYRYVYIEK